MEVRGYILTVKLYFFTVDFPGGVLGTMRAIPSGGRVVAGIDGVMGNSVWCGGTLELSISVQFGGKL